LQRAYFLLDQIILICHGHDHGQYGHVTLYLNNVTLIYNVI